MELERKALYNLIRFNWQKDPSLPVESWQVEEYRAWSLDELFGRMAELGFPISREFFQVCAEQCDVPEELTGCFLEEECDVVIEDQLYLVVFELWRRLVPDKLSLSIFCDELDHRMAAYDAEGDNDEEIQDGLANLQELFDENADVGALPGQVYEAFAPHLAHDIETFLYDYIDEQINDNNLNYSSELVEGLGPYMPDPRWFEFLRVRILASSDIEAANSLLKKVVAKGEPDLDFNLEVLDFLTHTGDRTLFLDLARRTASLVQQEEDLIDLLSQCVDYYRCLDKEDKEKALSKLIEARKCHAPDEKVDRNDACLGQLVQLLS